MNDDDNIVIQTPLKENPLKTMVRTAIHNGDFRSEFTQSVRRNLIKVSTNRQVTALRIKQARKEIKRYWKEILREEREANG